MSLENRVDPWGGRQEVTATGALMGNREIPQSAAISCSNVCERIYAGRSSES